MSNKDKINNEIKDPAFALAFRWDQFKLWLGTILFKRFGRNRLVDWLDGVEDDPCDNCQAWDCCENCLKGR